MTKRGKFCFVRSFTICTS